LLLLLLFSNIAYPPFTPRFNFDIQNTILSTQSINTSQWGNQNQRRLNPVTSTPQPPPPPRRRPHHSPLLVTHCSNWMISMSKVSGHQNQYSMVTIIDIVTATAMMMGITTILTVIIITIIITITVRPSMTKASLNLTKTKP